MNIGMSPFVFPDATTTAYLSGVAATTASTGEIDLVWSVNTADDCTLWIYRSTDGGSYTLVTSYADYPDLTSNTYADTSVAEGHDYSYQLQVTGPFGTSNFSDGAEASTAAIQNLDYAPTTTTQVLTWDNFSSTGTAIEVDISTDGTTFTTLTTTLSGSATAYTATGLSENTEYWFNVTITDGSGTTTLGPIDTWTLAAAATSLAPPSATANEVDLTWTNPGSSSTPFFIERSDDGGSDYAIIDETAPGATSYQDTTVDDDTGYDYEVAAVSNDGFNANPTSAVSVTTPLLAPTNLMAATNGPTEIDLSWSNTSQATAGYTIQRSTNGSTWTTAGTVAYADATYYSDTALSLATRYYYRVMATDSASTASAASNIATAVTGPTWEVWEGSCGSLSSAVVVDTDACCAACEVDPITSIDVDWGDGESSTISGDPSSMSHYYCSPGSYTVTAIANTADGPVDSSSTTATVTVSVPEPTLSFSATTETVCQAGEAVLFPEFCSDGASGESEYLVDWGDGTSYQSYADGTSEFEHSYAHGGTDYHVEAFLETSVGVVGAQADITVTGSNPFDDPGTYSTAFTLSDVTTDSGLPATTGDTVQAFVSASMNEYSCSCGCGTDPESECGTVDFGNSSSSGFCFNNSVTSSPSEAIDNNYHEDGQYLVTMTATDGSHETKFATVDNAVPVMNTIPEQVAGSGESFSVSDTFSNMSTELSPVAFIDWGDGTGPHAASLSESSGSGTITASTSSAPAPGVYTATLTLYPMGPTGTSGGPTYAVEKTFTLDVWGIKIDNGESNDLLVASSDGTENQQAVTLYFPHPAGEALTLNLSSTDASQNYLFSSGTKIVPSGSNYPAVDIPSGDSASSITYEDGAIEGNSTAGCLQYTLSGEYDASDSTTTFQSRAAAGCGTVPAEDPKSNPASLAKLSISLLDPSDPGGFGTDVTNGTQDWAVGQYVDLEAVVVFPDSVTALVSHPTYSWSWDGDVLHEYTADFSTAAKTELDGATGIYSKGITFFWVSASAPFEVDDVGVQVSLYSILSPRPIKVLDASTSFNVYPADGSLTDEGIPASVHFFTTKASFFPAPAHGMPGWQFQGRVGLDPGIELTGDASSPSGFGAGQWEFVQTVTHVGFRNNVVAELGIANTTTAETLGAEGDVLLDSSYPYTTILPSGDFNPADAITTGHAGAVFATGTTRSMYDAPSDEVTLSQPTGDGTAPLMLAWWNSPTSADMHFTDYLMYKPPGLGTWVPVKELTWFACWRAWRGADGVFRSVGSGPETSSSSTASEEPIWTNNVLYEGWQDAL